MPKPAATNRRYMPGLDGLRALAVVAVIAYHLHLKFAPGGLLGVGVFFVLSGYLITDLLIGQWSKYGQIRLRDFWISRARRLLPAMLTMLIVVVWWVVLFHPSQVSALWKNALSALLYVSNWWFIFHKVSYFSSFGLPSPLKHLWSLAVEEQFYLVWPLLLGLALKFRLRRYQLVGWTVVGITASALAMALLFHAGSDPSRVYYGTDTRAFSLLMGAGLAFVWPSRNLLKKLSANSVVILDLAGITGLLVVTAMMVFSNQYETFLYRGGMVLLSVATAAVVATLAHPSTRLARVIGCKPLRWLGVRSYGIYLWHYPVIILTSSAVNTGGIHPIRATAQVGASVVLASLSWKYLEEPIHQGALKRAWIKFTSMDSKSIRMVGFGTATAFVAVTVLSWSIGRFTSVASAEAHEAGHLSASAKVYSKSNPNASSIAGSGITVSGKRVNVGNSDSSWGASGTGSSGQTSPDTTTNAVYGTLNSTSPTGAGTSDKLPGKGVTAIGDSIMVDVAPYLKRDLPGIVVNGKIGRQMYQAPAVIKKLRANGQLGQRVIIELGTNGVFSKKQLISLIQSLGHVDKIVLVNTRVPRPWEKPVNAILASVAKTFPNTTLVNWYAASANKASLFSPDGVHLKPGGSKFLAALLAKAIQTN